MKVDAQGPTFNSGNQLEGGKALNDRVREISLLKDKLGRQKLATLALTRFLIEMEIIEAAGFADFISQADAEDCVIDGKITVDSRTRRLQFQEKTVDD